MVKEVDVSVLVVGAGPVGLSLAMDLAWRGIDVVVAEIRERGAEPEAKCNHVSSRTMEIFRRLGLAGKIRNAGLPADHANDVSYRTSFIGTELSRILIPCRRDRFDATDGPDTNWPTAEPPHRINQIYLEPIMFDHAAQMQNLTFLNRTSFESFDQTDDQVISIATDLDNGQSIRINSKYVVGADSGRSKIRGMIGAKFEGDAIIQRVQSTFIRAPSLMDLQKAEPAWATFTLNPRRSGNVYAIDGIEKFIVHNYLLDTENDFDEVDRDWSIRTILGVNGGFEYEIIKNMDWNAHRFVADKFRDRRVFICGDAAHIWVPYAGYGMNAGIADAVGLSWLMAAELNGWGAPNILDGYERERLPITQQVSYFVMDHAEAMAGQRGEVPDNIEALGPEGDALRKVIGKKAYDLNVQQYCCGGLNYGYFYNDSPLIIQDGKEPPPYSMSDFTPSTVPGCRTPHYMIDNGRSLYDAMGPEYTLLRTDPEINIDPLILAAGDKGVPLCILDISGQEVKALYDRKLILSRPDQHIAWRGDEIPENPIALIDIIRGASH
ncbi:MAG: FAD-dependent oxidoreductase [Rhodospirillales bacterium]|tara:strand:+ start:100 stop:1749 length:1650 start_codon:yes stop_codon:yes gene_type:complete